MAVVRGENGADVVRPLLFTAAVSTITLAEAYSKLTEWGGDGLAVFQELRFTLADIVPFSEKHAELAGALRAYKVPGGLSLADRCCLALTIELGATVYTADRAWAGLDLPCIIHLIR